MYRAIAILFFLVTASSCSRSVFDNEDIRCPFVDKGGCQSMRAINEMVNQNAFTADGAFVKQSVRIHGGRRYAR